MMSATQYMVLLQCFKPIHGLLHVDTVTVWQNAFLVRNGTPNLCAIAKTAFDLNALMDDPLVADGN